MTGDSFGQLLKAITMGNIVPLESVAPEVPVDVTTLVGRMLSLERSGRPNDLREPFDILSRYSDGRAISFAGPGSIEDSGSHPVGKREANAAFAPTELSDPAPADTDAGSGYASTRGGTFFERHRRGTALFGAGALVVVAGAALFFRSTLTSNSTEPSPSAFPDASSALPSESTRPHPSALTITPIAPTTPVPSASALPSASPSASSSGHRPPKHGGSVTTATASSTATPPSTPSSRLPGGVASTPPF
jgi:hypothetical protein